MFKTLTFLDIEGLRKFAPYILLTMRGEYAPEKGRITLEIQDDIGGAQERGQRNPRRLPTRRHGSMQPGPVRGVYTGFRKGDF